MKQKNICVKSYARKIRPESSEPKNASAATTAAFSVGRYNKYNKM